MAVDLQMLGIMIARRSMIVDIIVGTGSAIIGILINRRGSFAQ
jgi:hypothetical protein